MRPRGFSLIELLVAVAIILVLVTMALPHFNAGKQAANEAAAAAAIKTVHVAQQQYFADNGRFAASLEDLARAGQQYIGADLATGELSGYRFTISANAGGYMVHADPMSFNVTGRRCFYSDQMMVIHENRGAGHCRESPVQTVGLALPFFSAFRGLRWMFPAPVHELPEGERDFVGMRCAPSDYAFQLYPIVRYGADFHQLSFNDVQLSHSNLYKTGHYTDI